MNNTWSSFSKAHLDAKFCAPQSYDLNQAQTNRFVTINRTMSIHELRPVNIFKGLEAYDFPMRKILL